MLNKFSTLKPWMFRIGSAYFLLVLAAGCASQNRPLQLLGGEGPRYPQAAQRDGIEGEVVVVYDVDIDGRVVNARVLSGNPPGVFDSAALAAVNSWRFNPMIVDGLPKVARSRQSTVTFELDGADKYDGY